MKTILKCLFIVIFLLKLQGFCFSEEIRVSSAFLKIPPSPDAEGIGNAGTSLILFSSTYWNPSAISYFQRPVLSLANTQLSFDRRYNFINYIQPFSKFSIGLSYINFGVEGIELWTDKEEFFGITSNKENAYILTLARKISGKMSAGINLKYISQDVYNTSASGNGLDVGVLYKGKLSFGVVAQDIGGKIKWSTGSKSDIPLNLRFGMSGNLFNNKLLLSCDINKRQDEDTTLYFGSEYKITDNMKLRLGSSDKKFTSGIGVNFEKLQIDYSYKDALLGDTQKFQIVYNIVKEKKIKKQVEERVEITKEEEEEVVVEIAQKIEEVKTDEITEEEIPSKEEKIEVEEISEYEVKPEMIEKKEVVEVIEKIREDELEIYFINAMKYVIKKKFDEAKNEIKNVLKIDPKNARASAYIKRIDNIASILKINEASDAEEKFFRGAVCYIEGNFYKSLKYLSDALQVDSSHIKSQKLQDILETELDTKIWMLKSKEKDDLQIKKLPQIKKDKKIRKTKHKKSRKGK